MVFDASLNIIAVDAIQPEGENYLIIKMDVGLPLPLAQPGTQQPLVTPIGQLHFRIDRDTAIRWGGQIAEKGEKLKPASDIEVAQSLNDIEGAAKLLDGMRGE